MKTSATVYQGRQRTPGHFVSLLSANDSQAAMAAFVVPGLRGFLKRYPWNHLEPAMGFYDFTDLASDVAWCAARGLKLYAMILDKSFSGPTRMLPVGMEQYEMLNHGGSGSTPGTPSWGGYTAQRWAAAVTQQFNRLTAKIGAQFNALDAFEGIVTVETSLSCDGATLAKFKYSAEAYRDSYINILTNAAGNLPNSQVLWFMNFLTGNQDYLAVIADEVRLAGVSMGGPDILPTSQTLVDKVYPLYERFKGRMNLGAQLSNPGYAQENPPGAVTPYMTMDQMVDYARESLYLSSIFWMPVKRASPMSYGWTDAIPVIAQRPVINP